VADPDDASLVGLPQARWLDALVFSSPGRPWRDVMVAGRWALRGHRHADVERIAAAFARAMAQLWGAD
jgi:formimidoylglutamate deiminase